MTELPSTEDTVISAMMLLIKELSAIVGALRPAEDRDEFCIPGPVWSDLGQRIPDFNRKVVSARRWYRKLIEEGGAE